MAGVTEHDALLLARSVLTRLSKGGGWKESNGPRALEVVSAALKASETGVDTKAALLSAPIASERPATKDTVRWLNGEVIP